MSDQDTQTGPTSPTAQASALFGPPPSREASPMERMAILALKILAWIALVVGVLGGCAICGLGIMAGNSFDSPGYYGGSMLANMQRFMGLLIGLIIFLEGFIFWAMLLVFASMADSLIMIRKNTSRQ